MSVLLWMGITASFSRTDKLLLGRRSLWYARSYFRPLLLQFTFLCQSGDQEEPGIIPRAMKDVFAYIKRTPGREYLLRCSYLEIYNETIHDLLSYVFLPLFLRDPVPHPLW